MDGMGENEEWRKYDLMAHYVHRQCETSGWLNKINTPDVSVVGILMRLGETELARLPSTLHPNVISAFEGLGAAAAMTMSSEITASLFRQLSPYQTEIALNQHNLKIPVVASLNQLLTAVNAGKMTGSACIVRREKIIFLWTDSVESLLPHGAELEKLLIETLWGASGIRTKHNSGTITPNPYAPNAWSGAHSVTSDDYGSSTYKESAFHSTYELKGQLEVKEEEMYDPEAAAANASSRPMILTHSIMVGLAMFLLAFIQTGVLATLLGEIVVDGSMMRLLYLIQIPFTTAFALFFVITLIGCFFQIFHPTRDISQNSRFYSAIAPVLSRHRNVVWPHITIQIPVYKEGLTGVILPTVSSVLKAIRHYEKLGGTASIYMNEDGMQVVSPEVAAARKRFYMENDIGYCARPGHNVDGYLRKGQFKKASNMNYCLDFSIRVEDELLRLLGEYEQLYPEEEITVAKENELYDIAMNKIIALDGGKTVAGGNVRLGEIILLLDCDTKVPEDCLYLGALEMIESPDMAIIQHASGVMQVAHNFFENGTTYLTNLIYNSIQFGVGSGDLACFVGHNAFLRWKAVQSVAFEEDGMTKYWSDSHVSEDFDLALRLQIARFIIRLGVYHKDDNAFKEGVSLTVFDELARWQKYAYGCNELLFHPLHKWIYRGPFTPILYKLLFSNVKTTSKVTILGYVFTYYALASALPLTLMNYGLMGLIPESLDHSYLESFRVMFVLLIVFNGIAPIAYNIMLHRIGKINFFRGMLRSLQWMPMFIVFFGGISLHLCKAIFCHFFSIKMEWSSTSKELEETGFFIGLDKIVKDFKYMYTIIFLITGLMVYLGIYAPDGYMIISWTIILPLANQLVCHFALPLALGLF